MENGLQRKTIGEKTIHTNQSGKVEGSFHRVLTDILNRLSPTEYPGGVDGQRRKLLLSAGALAVLAACGKKSDQDELMDPEFTCELSSSVRVTDLPSEKFEEAEKLLERVPIDIKREVAIALLRGPERRVFVLKIPLKSLKSVGKNGGVISKGNMKLFIPEDGGFEGIIGRYNGNIYGVLAAEDEDGVSVFDGSEIRFGPCKVKDKEKKVKKDDSVIQKEPIDLNSSPHKIHGKYRRKPVHLAYVQKHNESRIEIDSNHFPDKNSIEGRILRSYRWKKITDAVERRYDIPNGLLLAMMAQEGYGDPTLPNMGGDGGLGLIHIQGVNAKEFGLKTLPLYTRRMRDLRHGNEIKHVLQKHNNNLKELIRYDDRFHPVMAVDVAARFLMEHFSRVKRTNPRMSQKDLWDLALKRYSGRPHYQYGAKVIAYRNKINDRQYIRGIASRFPSYGVKIGGRQANFDLYLAYNNRILGNYEIEKYEKLQSA